MNARITDCYVLHNEYGISVEGVYRSEAAAKAVAQARLNNLVKNGQWRLEKQYPEVLASMVEQATYYDFGVEDGE